MHTKWISLFVTCNRLVFYIVFSEINVLHVLNGHLSQHDHDFFGHPQLQTGSLKRLSRALVDL